jgi:hypothetical protein
MNEKHKFLVLMYCRKNRCQKENKANILDTNKKVFIEVNVEKTKYVFFYNRHAGQNQCGKLQNERKINSSICKEIKPTYNSGKIFFQFIISYFPVSSLTT